MVKSYMILKNMIWEEGLYEQSFLYWGKFFFQLFIFPILYYLARLATIIFAQSNAPFSVAILFARAFAFILMLS